MSKTASATGETFTEFARRVGITKARAEHHMKVGVCQIKPMLTAEEYAHPLRVTWYRMFARCYNPKEPAYPDYGGRGIRICARWFYSFQAFVSDMGERPEGYSIDRIDNDKDYCPENCRWADRRTQNNNMRRCLPQETKDTIVALYLQGLSPPQISEVSGIDYTRTYNYLRRYKQSIKGNLDV